MLDLFNLRIIQIKSYDNGKIKIVYTQTNTSVFYKLNLSDSFIYLESLHLKFDSYSNSDFAINHIAVKYQLGNKTHEELDIKLNSKDSSGYFLVEPKEKTNVLPIMFKIGGGQIMKTVICQCDYYDFNSVIMAVEYVENYKRTYEDRISVLVEIDKFKKT